jgi:hypothetical protein
MLAFTVLFASVLALFTPGAIANPQVNLCVVAFHVHSTDPVISYYGNNNNCNQNYKSSATPSAGVDQGGPYGAQAAAWVNPADCSKGICHGIGVSAGSGCYTPGKTRMPKIFS